LRSTAGMVMLELILLGLVNTAKLARTTRASFPACGSSVITSSDLRELADRSLSGDAPSSMSEPFRKWLGMGAPLPARIQPGSIDHVPFPTVGTCLGASLALREKARRVAWSESVAGCLDMQPSLGQRNPGFLGSAASTRSNATAGLGSFRACRSLNYAPIFAFRSAVAPRSLSLRTPAHFQLGSLLARLALARNSQLTSPTQRREVVDLLSSNMPTAFRSLTQDSLVYLLASAIPHLSFQGSPRSGSERTLIHESGLEELEGIGFNPATVQYETMECNGIDGRGLPAPKSDASLPRRRTKEGKLQNGAVKAREDLEYGRYGLEYGVLPSSGYGVLDLVSFVVFGECRHRYAVSSLMDTAYWLSE
ncbi:hypothetical protein Tco_1562027, partial [Tanacetum coccineum]